MDIRDVALDSSECILWPYWKNNKGYGTTRYEGRDWYVHRLAYRLHIGAVPDGMEICHGCDTPACYNPRHLFVGTHTDNMRDMFAKGRANSRVGDAHQFAKLTSDQVRAIRDEYRRGIRGRGHKVLAKKYGVSPSTMLGVINGTAWRSA